MAHVVRRLTPDLRDDFYALHTQASGAGWCHCVAWWVPTWEGWGERTAEQNRRLRDALFDRGLYDLWLLTVDEEPVASCQAGPRDRLTKLVQQMGCEPDPSCWAVTCFFVAPAWRRRGLARHLLAGVMRDLQEAGVQRVEAFPRCGEDLPDGEAWTGPELLLREAGFEAIEGREASVLSVDLPCDVRPRLYLDVDGVLLRSDEHGQYGAAPHLREFLAYAVEHFSVRWLTTHARDGSLGAVPRVLQPHLDEPCRTLVGRVGPAGPWGALKTDALETEDGDFLWVDDAPLQEEERRLVERGWGRSLVRIDPSDPQALLRARKVLRAFVRERSR